MKIGRVIFEGAPRFATVGNKSLWLWDTAPWHGGKTVKRIQREGAALLPPVAPSKIVAVARNYVAHAEELGHDVPTSPLFFLKPPSAIIGDGQSIVLPSGRGQVDFEGELGVVIGSRATQVAEADAMDHVFGYTCVFDITARAEQKRLGHFTLSKGFDTFCPVGPTIETELDPSDLRIETKLNDEVVQDDSTALMVHDIAKLIAAISDVMTLEPGDLIATGTPKGVGSLRGGDTLVLSIDGIGSITHPVVLRGAENADA